MFFIAHLHYDDDTHTRRIIITTTTIIIYCYLFHHIFVERDHPLNRPAVAHAPTDRGRFPAPSVAPGSFGVDAFPKKTENVDGRE